MSNTNTEILLAGTFAALTIDLLVYPLDTIKTRIQSQDYAKTFSKAGSDAASLKAGSNLFKGLYQGVGSVIITSLPAAGIFFTTYEATKTLYSGAFSTLPFDVPTPFVHALASSTSELVSCAVLTPAEVVKQNAQMLSGEGGSSTSKQAFRMLVQSEGGAMKGLLSGYTALVARNLPFTAMQFPMYEAVRRRMWQHQERKRQAQSEDGKSGENTLTVKDQDGGVGGGERKIGEDAMVKGLLETGYVNGVAAASSGAIAAVITTPSDVVKTRIMLMAGEKGSSKGGGRQQGTWSVAKQVYEERGMRGLFRGGLLRAGWTALGSGLYLSTYEVAKVYLKGKADGNVEKTL